MKKYSLILLFIIAAIVFFIDIIVISPPLLRELRLYRIQKINKESESAVLNVKQYSKVNIPKFIRIIQNPDIQFAIRLRAARILLDYEIPEARNFFAEHLQNNTVPQFNTVVKTLVNYVDHPSKTWGIQQLIKLLENKSSVLKKRRIDGICKCFKKLKCTEAVPALKACIERIVAKKEGGWWYWDKAVEALIEIEKERAVPFFLRLITTYPFNKEYHNGWYASIWAARQLKIKEAVPYLLPYVYDDYVIKAFRDIGDSRVIPALKKIVDSKGYISEKDFPEGVKPYNEPAAMKCRLESASLALAILESDDPTPYLCELLSNKSTSPRNRWGIIDYFSVNPDIRAVPYLVKIVKEDQCSLAVSTLGAYKDKKVIEELIKFFDIDFKHREGYTGYTEEMFQDDIATSLQKITGERFESDKNLWIKWWQEKGSKREDFK